MPGLIVNLSEDGILVPLSFVGGQQRRTVELSQRKLGQFSTLLFFLIGIGRESLQDFGTKLLVILVRRRITTSFVWIPLFGIQVNKNTIVVHNQNRIS